jgi:putative 4-mercaptohistidine N1-methyltranferase
MSIYEQDHLLSQYLDLHYGEAVEVLPWPQGPRQALDYPRRCVAELLDASSVSVGARALDVGCAVGRSSFELRAFCGAVVGIDLSARFIECAQRLQLVGEIEHQRVEEGVIATPVAYRVPARLPRDKVRFEVGDACRLRDDLGSFDVVLNANLIDRLPRPQDFLDRLSGLVRPGGQLILSSPFTWLEEFTPRSHWIGGWTTEGGPHWTWDGLCERLAPAFELQWSADLPFLIREHARKYQWSVARGGRWRRRD